MCLHNAAAYTTISSEISSTGNIQWSMQTSEFQINLHNNLLFVLFTQNNYSCLIRAFFYRNVQL